MINNISAHPVLLQTTTLPFSLIQKKGFRTEKEKETLQNPQMTNSGLWSSQVGGCEEVLCTDAGAKL